MIIIKIVGCHQPMLGALLLRRTEYTMKIQFFKMTSRCPLTHHALGATSCCSISAKIIHFKIIIFRLWLQLGRKWCMFYSDACKLYNYKMNVFERHFYRTGRTFHLFGLFQKLLYAPVNSMKIELNVFAVLTRHRAVTCRRQACNSLHSTHSAALKMHKQWHVTHRWC